MAKKDFGKNWNRGASNTRIFIYDLTDDIVPVRPVTNDLLLNLGSLHVDHNVKSADQAAISSTYRNDNDLRLDLPANATYEIELHVGIEGPSASNFKSLYTTTGTITLSSLVFCHGPVGTAGLVSNINMRAQSFSALTSGKNYRTDGTNISYVKEYFVIDTGASGGLIIFRWAQNTTGGTTYVKAGSVITGRQIKKDKIATLRYYDGSDWQTLVP